MTTDKLYCSHCGAAVTSEAKFCFKCGTPIQKSSLERSEPYRLDDKFKLCTPSLRTELGYSSHNRVWLLDGGFEKLHAFVNELCDLVYEKSSKVSPSESKNQCYDTISDIHFTRYDTDFYPPDGFESIFVEFRDYIPSPFGNIGVREEDTDFDRPLCIFLGRVEHDPDHGENNVSETEPPRLRKSKLVEKWGISVKHRFIDRKPTLKFFYSLFATSISTQCQYSTNYSGLLSVLGLEVAIHGQHWFVKGKDVTSFTEVREALSGVNGSPIESILEEEWRPVGIWQPVIIIDVTTGWFSSEKRRIYFNLSTGEQRPPTR